MNCKSIYTNRFNLPTFYLIDMTATSQWFTTAVFGLDIPVTFVGLIISILIIIWGFKRYRQTFSKSEFGIALLIALGLLSVTVLPGVFVFLANLLDISETFRAVQIIANIVFIFLILYVISAVNSNQATITRVTRSLAVQQATPENDTSEASIYIVVPAYNESETIGDVIKSLPKTIYGRSVRVVVVSDGSDDKTTQVANQHRAIVVEHLVNQGQGSALRTGFEIARQDSAEIVVTMDADGQHPADQLPDLIKPIIDNEADYVLGSRYLGRDASGNSLTRQSGIQTFTWIINIISKTNITDCTNGFRAIRGSQLEDLTLTEERFSAPELIIEARKNGLRIAEVPVTIHEREIGETKKPGLWYAVGLARTIFVTWVR